LLVQDEHYLTVGGGAPSH